MKTQTLDELASRMIVYRERAAVARRLVQAISDQYVTTGLIEHAQKIRAQSRGYRGSEGRARASPARRIERLASRSAWGDGSGSPVWCSYFDARSARSRVATLVAIAEAPRRADGALRAARQIRGAACRPGLHGAHDQAAPSAAARFR